MWLTACTISEFLCWDRHMFITPLLFLCFHKQQVTEIQKIILLTLSEPQWQQKLRSRSVLLHISYEVLKQVLEQDSSHFFSCLNFSSHSDRAQMLLSLLFWNWPLPTLLKITPVNEKKADLVTRALLPQSMSVPLTQAYNILLLSVFLRTVWWAADLSSAMYQHVALVTHTSPISCTCVWGCELGGKDGRVACGRARESSFSLQLSDSNSRTCQAANTHSKHKKHNLWDQAGFRSST